MDRGNGSGNGNGAANHRKVIFRPRTKREVRKYLKKPLSDTSAVIYFTETDRKPFLLGGDGGGIATGGAFKLTGKWKLTKDKLDRIYIITSEEDYSEADAKLQDPDETEGPEASQTAEAPAE